jgi:hypothetical protein
VEDQNTQSVEMMFLRRLDRRLRKHIRMDDERFASIEGKLSSVTARLNILLVLVVALIPAIYFSGHP